MTPDKKDLTAVSLFAGVGGFDLALERAGVKVVAAVEIDKNARGVLAKQFPNTKLFNNVTTVTGEDLRNAGFIPEHGIITGGFPCQDLSVAGKRAGLVGARSGLFYEIARIADETKAKWLVLENVPGLLSSRRGADMGAVVGTLVDIGYSVAWRVLDAQHFGVPQRRRRVFIVAERAGDPTGCAKVLFERQGLRGDTSTIGTPRENSAGSVGQSVEKPSLLTMREGKPGGGKGPLISIDQSLTLATQNSQVLYEPHHGDGLEPDYGDTVFDQSFRMDGVRTYEGVSQSLNARMGTGGNNVPLKVEAETYVKVIRSGARDAEGNLITDNPTVISPTLTAYSVREDAQSDTFSATELTAVNALQAHQPSAQSHHAQTFIVRPTLYEQNVGAVRRLTPTECERLQGFPDGWTSQRIDENKGLIEQADSSRYKQMGNAVAVPCVEWIVNRLVAYEQECGKKL
jgi:DNA (cytosine-5)-methyltransferase 1